MKDATKTHWTTFNELMAISNHLIPDIKYPGEAEKKLQALVPWAKGREEEPIPLSHLVRPLGAKQMFQLIKIDKHPNVHQAALDLGLRILKHGVPKNVTAIEAYQESVDFFKGYIKYDMEPIHKKNPYLAVFGVVKDVVQHFIDFQDKEEMKAELEWMAREFNIIFGTYPASDKTLKRIEGWSGKPFQGSLTLDILADAFTVVEKNNIMVSTILVSENTRRTLFHGLIFKSEDDDNYIDLGANFLWTGHIETGDIPDNKIFIIGESNCEDCVQRIDIAE